MHRVKKIIKEEKIRPLLGVGIRTVRLDEENFLLIDPLYQTQVTINEITLWIINKFKTGASLRSIAEELAKECEIDVETALHDVIESYKFCKKMKMVGKKNIYSSCKQKYLDLISKMVKNVEWY